MKKNRVVIIILFSVLCFMVIVCLNTGYIVKPKYFFCQSVAIKYLSLLTDGLVLSETREQDYDGTSFLQFFFEADRKADLHQMEGLLYKAWEIMENQMQRSDDLAQKNIDIVVFSYTYKFGTGIRNFDLNGDNRKNKWMLYNAEFESWEDINKYTDLEGMVGCDFMSLDNVTSYADVFDDLKYLYICVGKDEAEISENERELKEIFPNADVDHSKYQRIHTVYAIGKRYN